MNQEKNRLFYDEDCRVLLHEVAMYGLGVPTSTTSTMRDVLALVQEYFDIDWDNLDLEFKRITEECANKWIETKSHENEKNRKLEELHRWTSARSEEFSKCNAIKFFIHSESFEIPPQSIYSKVKQIRVVLHCKDNRINYIYPEIILNTELIEIEFPYLEFCEENTFRSTKITTGSRLGDKWDKSNKERNGIRFPWTTSDDIEGIWELEGKIGNEHYALKLSKIYVIR